MHVHPESVCVFLTAGAFYDVYSLSLPSPGVPVRTPRRPCARLPKTSASPGPPRGRGQPNVTWTLYRVVRGGQEEASGRGGGRRREGGICARGRTEVKEEVRRYVEWSAGLDHNRVSAFLVHIWKETCFFLHPKLLLDLRLNTLNHAECKQIKAPPLLSSVQMEKRGWRLFFPRSYHTAFYTNTTN